MPNARPSPVVRLIANTDTSVTSAITASTPNVPRIASMPMASGSSAATRLPNARTSRTRMIGTAMLSATARSRPTCSGMSSPMISGPPTVTSSPSYAPAYRSLTAVASPARSATIRACVPSVDTMDGAPVCQYDTTCDSAGSASISAVSAEPAAAASSTDRPRAETTNTRSASPSKCSSITSAASVESAPGSLKPPD